MVLQVKKVKKKSRVNLNLNNDFFSFLKGLKTKVAQLLTNKRIYVIEKKSYFIRIV